MNSPHTDTPEQKAIYNFVKNQTGNLLVIARAGTGKTTTMERAIQFIPPDKKVLVLAFNKAIAKEFQRRIRRMGRENVEAMTCHSFGLSVIRRANPRVQVDKNVYANYIRSNYTTVGANVRAILAATSLVKNLDLRSLAQIEPACAEHGIEVPASLGSELFYRYAYDMRGRAGSCGAIDYDDMIYIPTRLYARDRFADFQYDYVIVDEVQDLTPIQIALVLKAHKPIGGRIIAIGDDRQSIYGFRGADRNAIETVSKALSPTVLPLTKTFRCAKSIVAAAQRYVPDITVPDTAPDGVVNTTNLESCLEGVEYGDFILSRTNAPLVRCALRLMATDCRVAILGRDVGVGLAALIERWRVTTLAGLKSKVVEWATREAAKHTAAERFEAATLVTDKAECVLALIEISKDLADLKNRIDRLFSSRENNPNCVTLSTTHKAKGLERNRVWVLRDTYLRGRNGQKPSQEELNLYYVALTRARTELNIVRGLPGAA